MSAATQRGTFRVKNIYCHAKMTRAGMLIIQCTFVYFICLCYFGKMSYFDKKGLKVSFVWSYAVLAFGDMVVKIHALET
jgi:hypothetical protein